MGKQLQPRVIRSGPYFPSSPRTGDDSASILRKNNLYTVGQSPYFYERVYSGEGDLGQNLDMVALTGTLSITEDSTTVTGSGTLFLSECHLGQRILAMSSNET